MKILLIAVVLVGLVVAKQADEQHFFHATGTMRINTDAPVNVEGPIAVQFVSSMNVTGISGMHIVGGVKTPYGFIAQNKKVTYHDGKVTIIAECWAGQWGTKQYFPLKGQIILDGTWQQATYRGWCYVDAKKANLTFDMNGKYSATRFYVPVEAARRAVVLVGEKGETYQSVHVLNFAYLGFPYLDLATSCNWYTTNCGAVPSAHPGLAITGNDKKHCAIIDKDGDNFIHSNPVKKVVTLNPMTMLKDFFPNGYTFHECK